MNIPLKWMIWKYHYFRKPSYTATDRILEMKKGSRAAGIGKGSGPKPRQKISDITDFQKKNFGNSNFRILIL